MENGETQEEVPAEIGLAILNVGEGDFKITFDRDKPGERERAARVVREMLQRGYAIVVAVGEGKYRRVKKFDPKTCEYIITDVPKQDTRLDAQTTPAVAVARSSAGCARGAW